MKKRFNVSMSEFLLDELDYMASKKGMSRSALLAMLVSNEWNVMLRDNKVGMNDMTIEGQGKWKRKYDMDYEEIKNDIAENGFSRGSGMIQD